MPMYILLLAQKPTRVHVSAEGHIITTIQGHNIVETLHYAEHFKCCSDEACAKVNTYLKHQALQ